MYIYALKQSIAQSTPLVYLAERPSDMTDYITFAINDIAELDGKTLVELKSGEFKLVNRPKEGFVFDKNKGWVMSEEAKELTLAACRAKAVSLINDEAAKVYQSKDRFAQEYLLREAEAIAYKEAGYTGDVPRQVAAFATPAGIDAKTATDLIIKQASAMREAVNRIGELRMRAYELQSLTTEFDVNERAAQIVLEIRKVGEVL